MARLAAPAWATLGLAFLSGSAIAANAHYTLTDLGDLTTSRTASVTFVSAINDKGEIVGQSFNDKLHARAFLWRKGRMTDLGDLGPVGGETPALSAFSINSHSQIVGTSTGATTGTHARGFSWTLGLMLGLGTLRGSGTDTFATAVNNRGEIVGAGYRSPGDLRALRFVLGIPLELGAMADGRTAVQAFGINDKSQVVGYLSPGGTVAYAHAFLWKSGKFTDLGTLPGTNLSFANAVNNHGQVIGQSLNTGVPGTAQAFLWEDGALLDLGKAAASHQSSEALAINEKGDVVGTSGTSTVSLAWLWREGKTQDLNTLIATSDPNRKYVRLTLAAGINERGAIAAQGIDSRKGSSIVRGYLLTPVK